MVQKTMSEREQFVQAFGRECQTTLKLLNAYPTAKGDYRPHERSSSAKQLGWTFVIEQGVADKALQGKLDFT